MSPVTHLHDDRLAAAHASGGTSSGPIHDAVVAAARAARPDAATILDFGSGSGSLLPALAIAFPDAALHAADIMAVPPALPPGVTWHSGDLNDAVPVGDARFDLVCAVEVIEHLENPRHMLREITRLLRPDGVAVLSTPNTGSLRSLITFAVRGHHAQFDDVNYPAHITPIAAIDFDRAGREAGLLPERFFYTDHGAVPKLLSRRWQNIPLLGKRLRGRWFSDNFGVVLRKPA